MPYDPEQARDEHGRWAAGAGADTLASREVRKQIFGVAGHLPPVHEEHRGDFTVGESARWTSNEQGQMEIPGLENRDAGFEREVASMEDLTHPSMMTGRGYTDDNGDHVNEVQFIQSNEFGKVAYKPVEGEEFWHRESTGITNTDAPLAEREVLASRVDEALGFNMVPTTRMVNFEGRQGSAMNFVKRGEHVGRYDLSDEDLGTMGILDVVIGNQDRHGQHAMEDGDGKVWGIDHGYSFGVSPPGEGAYLRSWATYNMTNTSLSKARQKEIAQRLDRTNWNRLLSKSHLSSDERESFLQRVNVTSQYLSEGRMGELKDEFNVDGN